MKASGERSLRHDQAICRRHRDIHRLRKDADSVICDFDAKVNIHRSQKIADSVICDFDAQVDIHRSRKIADSVICDFDAVLVLPF